jgi:hypothetical protein
MSQYRTRTKIDFIVGKLVPPGWRLLRDDGLAVFFDGWTPHLYFYLQRDGGGDDRRRVYLPEAAVTTMTTSEITSYISTEIQKAVS